MIYNIFILWNRNRTHLRELKKSQPIDNVLNRLHSTGFNLISRMNMGYRPTINFLMALIDFYFIEYLNFIIGDKKITLTLEDVARIIDFSINEKPMIELDYTQKECIHISNKLLLSSRFIHKTTNVI